MRGHLVAKLLGVKSDYCPPSLPWSFRNEGKRVAEHNPGEAPDTAETCVPPVVFIGGPYRGQNRDGILGSQACAVVPNGEPVQVTIKSDLNLGFSIGNQAIRDRLTKRVEPILNVLAYCIALSVVRTFGATRGVN